MITKLRSVTLHVLSVVDASIRILLNYSKRKIERLFRGLVYMNDTLQHSQKRDFESAVVPSYYHGVAWSNVHTINNKDWQHRYFLLLIKPI